MVHDECYGFSMAQNASPRAQNMLKKHLLEHPKWSTMSVRRNAPFEPFLTHFWSQNNPFSRHFGAVHGSECFTTGSQ